MITLWELKGRDGRRYSLYSSRERLLDLFGGFGRNVPTD